MTSILTVREHETIKIGDKFSKEEKIITRFQANSIEKWEKEQGKSIFKWGNKKIIPQQWVGILGLSNLQIEILPKIEINEDQKIRKNLLYMLSIAKEIPFRENEIGRFEVDKNTFLESYITVFLDKLKWALKKGIIHEYSQRESNEKFIKGKLVVSKHIQKNISNKTNFYIRYDEFSINNIANRIIKATIIRLIGLTQKQDNLKNLHVLKQYFLDIDERKFSLLDFSKLNLTRANKHYHKLLVMCELFWREESPSFHSGEVTTFSLLFDMNKIYESFIQNILENNNGKIFDNEMYLVNKGEKSKFLFKNHLNRNVFKLIPDNIIFNKTTKKAVKIIDTKWKVLNESKRNSGISQSDIYQMYAYAREFACEEIILLYPQISNDYKPLPVYFNETFSNHKIKLSIRTVNLNVSLPEELSLIIDELKTYF